MVLLKRYAVSKDQTPQGGLYSRIYAVLERVTTAAGIHLFPFRTEKLSPPAPMVLRGRPRGRVGRRPFFVSSTPSSMACEQFSTLQPSASACQHATPFGLRFSARPLRPCGLAFQHFSFLLNRLY